MYFALSYSLWDGLCEPHWKSMFYKAEAFLNGPHSLKKKKSSWLSVQPGYLHFVRMK